MKMWIAQIVVDLGIWIWIYFAFIVGYPIAAIAFLWFSIILSVISLLILFGTAVSKERLHDPVPKGRRIWSNITTVAEVAVIALLGFGNIATIYFMGFLFISGSRFFDAAEVT